ncbi:MAG: aminotransferase class IV, partial [Candidatus Peribacteraceae bacterium]|nr:aminotransferase class IV [Candidatus Peribacteraceae bacterium]
EGRGVGVHGTMHVGGGITVLSDADAEWRELKLKARFLTIDRKPFKLIETLRFEKGSFLFLEEHLSRLQDSAAYFDFRFNRATILEKLLGTALRLNRLWSYRVRFLLGRNGEVTLSSERIEQAFGSDQQIGNIVLSKKHVDSSDVFLFHKTTNRDLYNREYSRAKKSGFVDAIFQNERGELTEGAITNLFLRFNSKLYTPPLSCGLLKGVLRQHLISEGSVTEKILFPEDLASAEEIYVGNSVRGLMRVTFSDL